jgi:hypothetical protein
VRGARLAGDAVARHLRPRRGAAGIVAISIIEVIRRWFRA